MGVADTLQTVNGASRCLCTGGVPQRFRNFRLDRMGECTPLDETFEDEPGKTLNDFFAELEAQMGESRAR